MDLVLDRLVAELVGCAIREAGLDATASQPGREPLGIMIAPKIAGGSFLFSGILISILSSVCSITFGLQYQIIGTLVIPNN